MYETIWAFKTARFEVRVTAIPADRLDLPDDDALEILARIDDGSLCNFDVEASVYLDGAEIASDYLGGCIYESPDDFRDHVGLARIPTQNRARKAVCAEFEEALKQINRTRRHLAAGEWCRGYAQAHIMRQLEAMAKARATFARDMQSAGHCGSYFVDMVQAAIAEARDHVERLQALRLRKTAA